MAGLTPRLEDADDAFVFGVPSAPIPPLAAAAPTYPTHVRNWRDAVAQRLFGAASVSRVLYFTRFPLMFGALPFLLVFGVAWKWMPAIARNGFLVESYTQLVNLTWISLMYAAAVTLSFRVTGRNAAWRFRDYRNARERLRRQFAVRGRLPADRLHGWPWLWWLLMGLTLPGYALSLTVRHPNDWTDCTPLGAGMAIAVGAMAAVGMLFAAAALQQTFLDPDTVAPRLFPFEHIELFAWLHRRHIRILYPISSGLGWAFRAFGPGYTVRLPAGSRHRVAVAPGHAQLALFGVLAAAAYYIAGFTTGAGEGVPDSTAPLPPLAYLLLAGLVGIFLFSSLSFWLDYYRVPVLLIAFVATAGLAYLRRSDHYYSLAPARPERRDAFAQCALEKVYSSPGWRTPTGYKFAGRDGKRTLVVVTASGGGIQASAWIAQVLMGLDERYADFTRSVGMVSAVSGGSVGTMYSLLHRRDREAPLPPDAELYGPDARKAVFDDATASSLEPVAWGFAYRDLWRSVLPGLFDRIASPVEDRGWAIERVWERRLERVQRGYGALTLGQLAQRVAAGGFPVPVFNATLVETGQRFLISPLKATRRNEALCAREFTDLYKGMDLPVTTATRLSATFSYISPICRPQPLPADADVEAVGAWESAAYHVADGGYVDNEGLVAAVEWVKELLSHYAQSGDEAPFHRIVFVRVFPFPLPDRPEAADAAGGWSYALAGPIATVLNGRTASQTDRGALELALLQQFSDAEIARRQKGLAEPATKAGMPAVLVRDANPAAAGSNEELFPAAYAQRIEVQEVAFVFRPDPEDALVPLNWKLTQAERERIRGRWKKLRERAVSSEPPAGPDREDPLRALDRLFTRRSDDKDR